jgi:PAP2 superfamily
MVPWTGAILILAVSVFRRDQRQRWQDMVTVMGYAAFVGLGTQIHILLIRLTPRTYDPVFLRGDQMLGFDTMRFAQALSHHGLLMLALLLGYILMPAVVGLAWVREQDRTMRRAALIAGCLCFVGYAFFPAVGPAWYDWTRHLPEYAPRNAMPSMHFTWALLIALNARSRRLQVGLWGYAVLLAVATLALREHYLVDLIAAVPYTLGIQWIARQLEGVRFRMPLLWRPALPAESPTAPVVGGQAAAAHRGRAVRMTLPR